jgi:hypothetical protein
MRRDTAVAIILLLAFLAIGTYIGLYIYLGIYE